MNHAQRLVTFAGTVLCTFGLFAGEGFMQADSVEPGTGRIDALITYKADGFSGLLFGAATLDQTVWTIAE